MNKTTILAISTSAIAVLAVFAFSSNEVDAIKPPTEEQTSPVIELRPAATSSGVLSQTSGAMLFYGDNLCRIIAGDGTKTLYIEFATPATVEHQSVCISLTQSVLINLEGNVDANFQPGDILVLDRATGGATDFTEVHREQTL